MEQIIRLVSELGPGAWLALATFVFPGVVVVALEWWRGREVEFASYVRSAIFLPLAVGLAAVFWRDAIGRGDDALTLARSGGSLVVAKSQALVLLGAALSALLFVAGTPAVRRARRLRKPLSPPPAT